MRDPAARRLLRESRAARPALAASAVVGVVAAALTIAQAALLAAIVARAFIGHEGLAELRGSIVALACVMGGRALVAAAFDHVGRLGALRVMSELRGRLARHLLVVRPGLSRGARSGELATAAVQGVDALEAWFSGYLPQVVLSAIVPPAVLVYVATRDLTAAIVLAVTVPVLILFMVLVGLAASARTRARWEAMGVLGAHFADVVRGLPTLKANARDRAQEETVARIADRYRRETMGTLRVAFLSAFVLELCAMIGTALAAATVGIQLAEGHLGLEDGLCVLLLAPELYAPLRGVGQKFHASADGLASAERIFAVLDEAPAAADDGAAAAPDPATAPIVFDAITYAHPGREGDVVRDASLTLRPGETVALVGPSGAGKSTLVSLLLRLADPDAGTISCGGVDLLRVDRDAWRARLSWVPQRPAIVAGTIADNIRLAWPDALDDEVRTALARAGGGALLAELDTRVGDGGRPLSAGEAQRVALARAFLRDAPLVVLDEPTAHLDAATAAEVGAAIAELCAGRTALLVVHRPELAAQADRTVEMRDGVIAATSAPLEVAA